MNERHLSLIGSTGSIGTQTLEIAKKYGEIKIHALSCNSNIKLLEEQIRRFKPEIAGVFDKEAAKALKENIKDTDTKVYSGMEGLIKCAAFEKSDMVLTAVVGMIGIEPTISAIEAGKDIALANKETLVCAGSIIMELAKKKGVKILPVDSEHSAIFQSLQGAGDNRINKILLTASGGPFFGKSTEELKGVKKADALKHPNWDMGAKITIDSATLVNKGLEMIEACHLFGVTPDKIEILIHRESILHSAVEFEDGAVLGQMGVPDMALPIAYALFYPERRSLGSPGLSLTKLGNLSFYEPDMETFKGLLLAFKAMEMGGNMPAVFNGANEIAVSRFLRDEIGFLDIPRFIESAMERTEYLENPGLEDILGIMPRLQKEDYIW